jgi:hypothetical protein
MSIPGRCGYRTHASAFAANTLADVNPRSIDIAFPSFFLIPLSVNGISALAALPLHWLHAVCFTPDNSALPPTGGHLVRCHCAYPAHDHQARSESPFWSIRCRAALVNLVQRCPATRPGVSKIQQPPLACAAIKPAPLPPPWASASHAQPAPFSYIKNIYFKPQNTAQHLIFAILSCSTMHFFCAFILTFTLT